MSLRVWLPLTKDLRQQGLNEISITNNGTTYSSTGGKLGGCYIFDGVDDAITIGNLSTLVTDNFSFVCWFYHDDTWSSKNYETIFGGPSGFELETKSGSTNSPVIRAYSWGQGTFTYELNKWNHLVMTRTTSETKFYLNGELKLTGTAGTIPSGNYFIGSWSSTTGQNFKGKVNDVRIYDHCLSPMEVKELAKGLVLHYPLNRNGWGQENLIKGSNTNIALNGSDYSSKTTHTYDTATGVGRIEVISAGSWNAWRFGSSDLSVSPATLSSGATTYTFSVDIRVTNYSSGDILATFDFRTNNSVHSGINCTLTSKEKNGSWHRVYGSFTTGGQSDNQCLFCITSNATTGNVGLVIEYKNFKLEEGDKPTPWCPNSSDALATTMGLNSTTEYDCSGFCNNGTRTGTFSWTSDTPKYSVSTKFLSNTYISYTQPVNSMYQATYAFWVKMPSFPSYGMLHGTVNNPASGDTPWFALNTENSELWAYFGNNSPNYHKVSGTLNTNTWYHCVWVWNNGVSQWYLNGNAVGNTVTWTGRTYITNSTNASIGDSYTDSSWGGTEFPGWLSDFRIYATALSADDVKSLYQNSAYIDSSGNVYGAVHSEV